MAKTTKNINPIVSIDWTGTQGETPFFEQSSSTHPSRYCVSVDTKKNQVW